MKAFKIIVALVACCALGFLAYNLAGGRSEPPDTNIDEAVGETPVAADGQKQEAETAAEEPESPADNNEQGENNDEFGKKLNEILLSASEYYNDTIETTPIITQDGRLYNAAADMTITQDYLLDMEYMPEGYSLDGAAILYILPEDFARVAPEFGEYADVDDKLKLFVAAPFEDGYLFDAKGMGGQIKISAEDFGTLLFPYRVDLGEIRRVTGSTEDYQPIIAAINEFRGTSDEFYVRYGMRNDKYAVMIVSPKSSYESIHEYVVENEDGRWQVRVANLETVPKSKVVANNVCPDLKVSLMPDYDVNSYMGMMRNDFEGVTEALVADGYITEENPEIEYISSTDQFMYVKYTNGQLFLGVNSDDLWVLGEVSNPENALGRFKSIDEKAPDFVIIWE